MIDQPSHFLCSFSLNRLFLILFCSFPWLFCCSAFILFNFLNPFFIHFLFFCFVFNFHCFFLLFGFQESSLLTWQDHTGKVVFELFFFLTPRDYDSDSRSLCVRSELGTFRFEKCAFETKGEWHHLAFSHDRVKATLFLDGKFVQSFTSAVFPSNVSRYEPLTGLVGSSPPGAQQTTSFCGQIGTLHFLEGTIEEAQAKAIFLEVCFLHSAPSVTCVSHLTFPVFVVCFSLSFFPFVLLCISSTHTLLLLPPLLPLSSFLTQGTLFDGSLKDLTPSIVNRRFLVVHPQEFSIKDEKSKEAAALAAVLHPNLAEASELVLVSSVPPDRVSAASPSNATTNLSSYSLALRSRSPSNPVPMSITGLRYDSSSSSASSSDASVGTPPTRPRDSSFSSPFNLSPQASASGLANPGV